MPTKEGWLTIDEERAVKDRAKKLRQNQPAPVEDLPMTISLPIGQWRSVVDGDPGAVEALRAMLSAYITQAEQVR